MTNREAYDHFALLIERFQDTQEPSDWDAVVACLDGPLRPFQSQLLCCMADNEVELDEPITRRLGDFLEGPSDLARSAALALAVGGQDAKDFLGEKLNTLPDERANDLHELLTLGRAW